MLRIWAVTLRFQLSGFHLAFRTRGRQAAHEAPCDAEPLAVAGNQNEATLRIQLSKEAGPFNLPLEIFAQTDTAGGAASHSGAVRVELTRPNSAADSALPR
jgi:hypothetical protein